MSAIDSLVFVEDRDDDALMIETSIDQCECVESAERLHGVTQAVAFLDSIPETEKSPSLMLVDINLPDGSGFSVVEHARRRFDRRTLPVVVFSGSENPADVQTAYEIGANIYMTKPMSFEQYRHQIAGLCRFINRN